MSHGVFSPESMRAFLGIFRQTAIGLGVCAIYGAASGAGLLLVCAFAGLKSPPFNLNPELFLFILCLPGTALARYLLTSQ